MAWRGRIGSPVLVFLTGGAISLFWGSLGALVGPDEARPWLEAALRRHPTLSLAVFYALVFGCVGFGLGCAHLFARLQAGAAQAGLGEEADPEGEALAALVERVARLGERYQEEQFRELVGLLLHLALRTTRGEGLEKHAFWYCRGAGPPQDDTFQTTLLNTGAVDALAHAVGFLPMVQRALVRPGIHYYPDLVSQAHLRVSGDYTLPDCGSALVLSIHFTGGRRGVLGVYTREEGRLGSARDRRALERLGSVLRVLYLLVPEAEPLQPMEGGRLGGAQK
ncbi:MAG: hypothetical protein L6E13_12315 [Firmicutes bacterium]|nr:hypothetical protein [Bacillota bacterium]